MKGFGVIYKLGGGILLSIRNSRTAKSYICGTNGISNCAIAMVWVYNDTARGVEQGFRTRKGACSVSLEPWHTNILEFSDLGKKHCTEEQPTSDLLYGLWIWGFLMTGVKENRKWSLFRRNESPELSEVYGEEFETFGTYFKKDGCARHAVDVCKIYNTVLYSRKKLENLICLQGRL